MADDPTPRDEWLVVGLGNPGSRYEGTRHNVGYLVVDVLAERLGLSWRKHRTGRADVAEGRLTIGGPRLVLMRGRCYMNESGGPVSAVGGYEKIDPDHLVVIHDELDIDLGRIRIKFGGGDNGHNGLRSIRGSTGSGDYFRVRVGIGRPPGRQSTVDYVLRPFSRDEREELAVVVEEAADSVESLITNGLAETQSMFNR